MLAVLVPHVWKTHWNFECSCETLGSRQTYVLFTVVSKRRSWKPLESGSGKGKISVCMYSNCTSSSLMDIVSDTFPFCTLIKLLCVTFTRLLKTKQFKGGSRITTWGVATSVSGVGNFWKFTVGPHYMFICQ